MHRDQPEHHRNPTPTHRRRLVRWLVAALALAAAVYVWDEHFKYRFFAKRFGVVVPGAIYRSGQISKWMIRDVLQRYAIAVVIDLQHEDPEDEHQRAEIEAIRESGLTLQRFKLDGDGTGDLDSYADALELMHTCREQGRPVLVHCGAGAQRTGGLIAAWRMLIERRPAAEAWDEMREYGWRPAQHKVTDYMNAHLDDLARRL
ncbi:MAG: dual specificity protein phosphatase family protein, partial [Planctomycetes bacterium]|nr:dual specificity protein phosphatase family protein [Planctomycetota bacterium]